MVGYRQRYLRIELGDEQQTPARTTTATNKTNGRSDFLICSLSCGILGRHLD